MPSGRYPAWLDTMTTVLPDLSDRPRFGLLAGVRVLDLTSSLAGPYATLLLADMGAEVVKIERPGIGDDARQWGPPFLDGLSLWYASVNRNKASVTLDYAAPDGKAVLDRMVAEVDVVVTNMRPPVQEKLGVDHRSLQALRWDLVHCSITGFGLTGRRRDLASYDLIAEGYSGVMDLTGEPESPPQKVGTPAADLLAGMDGAFAVVAALLERGMLFSLRVDAGPSIPQVGTGWHLDGAPNGGASAPRPLGADSDDVLHRWAGLAPAEIAGLRAAGVI